MQNPSRASIGAKRNPETETAILDAAQAILAEKGVAGLRMEAVAKRARAGKATLYKWYPSRGALVLAVYQRRKLSTSYKDTGSLEGDVSWLVAHVFERWRGDLGTIFKCIIAEAQSHTDVSEALQQYRTERLAGVLELVDRAVRRAEIGGSSPSDAFAEQLLSFMWQRLITDQIDEDPMPAVKFLVAGLKNV